MHVIATAGHVDHGKSTLVRALTGMEPDRWAEEKRRGMTIDLGYAWTSLPTGETVAFVDVPGHSRFVGNMLAGVGPAPAVLFVVAADQGWSMQSTEHLAALHALGVHHGVLAITRSDLADPAAAQAESLDHLRRTSLRTALCVAVSATTGAGLADLRGALHRMLAVLPPPAPTSRVRLWVDRCFTVKGAGTVVTGTLQAGQLAAGDRLVLASSGAGVRVRALQTLQESATDVSAVSRVAVNVAGAGVADIERGDALLSVGHWRSADVVDIRLTAGTPPDGLAAHLLLYVGAAAVAVHVRPLGSDTVRLTLKRPLPLQNGDRGVLRDPGRQRIVAGIEVLDAAPPPLDRRGAARARALLLADFAAHDPVAEIERRRAVRRQLLVELGYEVPVAGDRVRVAGEWLVSAATWAAFRDLLLQAVAAHHGREPLSPGLPLDAALHSSGVPDRQLLLAITADTPGIDVVSGVLRAADYRAAVPEAVHALVARLQDRPYAAPTAADRLELGLTAAAIAAAERAGLLLRLDADVVLTPESIDAAIGRLSALEQPFSLAAARDALGCGRRVALAVLEHLDRRHVTSRDADQRRSVISPRSV